NPELVRILAEGHAEHWGKHTFPDCLRGLCDKWPNTSWLELPITERKRIVDMVDNPLRDVPKFEPDEIGFSGRPIFRNYGSFSEDDWKALNWFRDNQDWTSPFKLVRDGNQKRIYAVLNLDCSESAGKHGKRLKNWMATCLRAAKIRQRNWRKGRKSARLVEMFGLNGSPLDLLHALAALRLHRRHKNFEKACELSKQLTKKPIYANERKWQAAIRKARHALQTIFPVPK
ncbi:MAG TPA: hypothetical protein VF492_11850, partial [Verrucomicrobiae bacterium]